EATLGLSQSRRLPKQTRPRQSLAAHLTRALGGLPGLRVPPLREGCEHVYYVYPLLYDASVWGIPRARFLEAVGAEGIPISGGYVKPLYLSPLYQERRAWAFRAYRGDVSYAEGICPVAERLHRETMLLIAVVRPPARGAAVTDMAGATWKVREPRSSVT